MIRGGSTPSSREAGNDQHRHRLHPAHGNLRHPSDSPGSHHIYPCDLVHRDRLLPEYTDAGDRAENGAGGECFFPPRHPLLHPGRRDHEPGRHIPPADRFLQRPDRPGQRRSGPGERPRLHVLRRDLRLRGSRCVVHRDHDDPHDEKKGLRRGFLGGHHRHQRLPGSHHPPQPQHDHLRHGRRWRLGWTAFPRRSDPGNTPGGLPHDHQLHHRHSPQIPQGTEVHPQGIPQDHQGCHPGTLHRNNHHWGSYIRGLHRHRVRRRCMPLRLHHYFLRVPRNPPEEVHRDPLRFPEDPLDGDEPDRRRQRLRMAPGLPEDPRRRHRSPPDRHREQGPPAAADQPPAHHTRDHHGHGPADPHNHPDTLPRGRRRPGHEPHPVRRHAHPEPRHRSDYPARRLRPLRRLRHRQGFHRRRDKGNAANVRNDDHRPYAGHLHSRSRHVHPGSGDGVELPERL